jgi:hypothetical protein
MAGLTHMLFGVLPTQNTAQDRKPALLQQINTNLALIKNFK